MITIVIPNRNRDLSTVKRTLSSIVSQRDDEMRIIVVDYGSDVVYQMGLKKLLKEIGDVEVILCQTQAQLWNKSRAINIALKRCETSYFMVADMDMIFHPQFIEEITSQLSQAKIIYFPVGVLTREESLKNIPFNSYNVKFITDEEATGISIFPTTLLKSVNGFDEYYHGWGSEDTDIHIRLKNNGSQVVFKKGTLYFLHQWHPKEYRSRNSTEPFCSLLEQTNAAYLQQTMRFKRILANEQTQWGLDPKSLKPEILYKRIALTNRVSEVIALTNQLIEFASGTYLDITIKSHGEYKTIKDTAKKLLKKKRHSFMALEKVNDSLLLGLVGSIRNSTYKYAFSLSKQEIRLQIEIVR